MELHTLPIIVKICKISVGPNLVIPSKVKDVRQPRACNPTSSSLIPCHLKLIYQEIELDISRFYIPGLLNLSCVYKLSMILFKM